MTTPRLMLITITGTLAYLGLAILGWGGFAAFLSHPPLIRGRCRGWCCSEVGPAVRIRFPPAVSLANSSL
jgi:hypothetical protein